MSQVRSCRATRDQGSGPGLAVVGRPASSLRVLRWPSHSSRIRVERAATRGVAGPGARCPAAAGGAGAGLPGRPEPAGPSITKGWVSASGIKKQYMQFMKGQVPRVESDIPQFGQVYISWPLWPVPCSTSFRPGLVHFYAPCHVATCLPVGDPALRLFMLSARLPVRVSLPSSESQRFLSHLSQARRPSDGVVVRVAGSSVPCCLSCGGAACPGRAWPRYGRFVLVMWSVTRVRVPGPPVSGSRRGRQSQVHSFRVALASPARWRPPSAGLSVLSR